MKKSSNDDESGEKPKSSQGKNVSPVRRRNSSTDDGKATLGRTKSVMNSPRVQESKAPVYTSPHLEGDDYKLKKAEDFMPSQIIPGVKFPPTRKRTPSDGEPDGSNPTGRRKSWRSPAGRMIVENTKLHPKKATGDKSSDHPQDEMYGPAATSKEDVKVSLKISKHEPPDAQSLPEPTSQSPKKTSLPPSSPQETLLPTPAPKKTSLPTPSSQKDSPQRTSLPTPPPNTSLPPTSPQQPSVPTTPPQQTAVPTARPPLTSPQQTSLSTPAPQNTPLSPKTEPKTQNVTKLPGGRVVIENIKKQPQQPTVSGPDEDTYGPTPTNIGDVNVLFKVSKPAKPSPQPPPSNPSTSPKPSSKKSPSHHSHLTQPETPGLIMWRTNSPTLIMEPSQTVTRMPGGRVVVENKRKQPRKPVLSEPKGPDITEDTYDLHDTNKDDVKILFKVTKPSPQQPPPPKPPSPPPPPPPPPPKPQTPPPKAPPPIIRTPPIQAPKPKPTLPPPPPPPAPAPLLTVPVREEDKVRTKSNALIEYLENMSKLTHQELEHDEIPSAEFADENIDIVDLLHKFGIPDQQRALDSLLDIDSVHFDFGGLMRQYYSYVLRSYCPINMQDRYRGASQPANCFTSVDLSKIGSRDEELDKQTKAKLRKLDEKREQLRHVSVDDDHFNYLKNLASDQPALLPLTIVHMLNEQLAPILEDVFRFYGKNLGTEHKSTKEAGFHYMKIRKRCEMYSHICGGSTIDDDLTPYYK